MAVGRVLCLGTGNPLTSPRAEQMPFRTFVYSPPGKIVTHFQGDAKEHLEMGRVFRQMTRVEECNSRYGLLVIEDHVIPQLKQQVLPVESALRNEFEDSFIQGHTRAESLAQRWGGKSIAWDKPNYGAILIKGVLPTEEEIKTGQENRQKYAMLRLREAKRGQVLRMQGAKGFKQGFDPADEAWALEYGVKLDIPLEMTAPKQVESNEEVRVPCPECGERIIPTAVKCRFCQTSFSKSVLDMISEPEVVKRGPGRPHKEEAVPA